LRIFSDINCYNFQINTKNFLGVEIKEEIISCIKSTNNEIFRMAPDINWIGLLMNPSEFNKYLSPKMTYIYSYLESICFYAFKPDEENKIKYKEIIHKMINFLFNAIIKGKLDEFFSLVIPDITKKDRKGKELDEMLLYLTNLPEVIQNKFKEESEQKEKELNKKFTEDIKSINDIYSKNKDAYEKLKQAIQEDSKEEIKKRIESDYTKRKNELESQCATTQGKLTGYMEIIKNINENKLSLNDYKREIDKLIKAKNEINHIENNKYFSKKNIVHKCFKIKLKKDISKFRVIYDEETFELEKYKVDNYFYINCTKNAKKALQLKKKEKEKELILSEGKYYEKQDIKFFEIDENSKKKELDYYKEKIKSIEKKEEKDFPLIMIFNKVHKIVIEKTKEDEYSIKDEKNKNLKNLEEIMKNGKNSLQDILTRGIDIINNNSFTIDNIKNVIDGLKKINDKMNILEFITPKFENNIGSPKNTSDFCDKFKNEFKDRIMGRLKSLIEYYDKFISNKYQTKLNIEKFESSFSLVKFDIKRPTIKELKIEKLSKFTINYPYIALLSDSKIQKLQFGYNLYELNIGPIITSFYTGARFIYSIVSFVDKNLSAKLIYDEEKMDEETKKLIPYFTIKQKIFSSEEIKISFTVPNIKKKVVKTLFGHLEIKVEEGEIEPISINFKFNVILIPLEIYFISKNGELFWNENRLALKNNTFSEDELLGFEYKIKNFNEIKGFLNNNYSLRSVGKNEVENNPIVIQEVDNLNNYIIQIPQISKKQEFLECLLKLYFTNNMTIPLELSGKIKKTEFKVYYMNNFKYTIEEQQATLFLYKHNLKKKKPYDIELHFLVYLFDKKKHKFNIEFPKISFKEYDVTFSLKNDYKPEQIKEYQTIDIIARVGQFFNNNKYSISFIVDGEEKKVAIITKKETSSDKFVNVPYKYVNNEKKAVFIDKKGLNQFEKSRDQVICYSPYCVKIYKSNLNKDISMPFNNKDMKRIEGINIIVFSEKTNYWLPNTKEFGDNKFDEKKIIEIDKSNIKNAKNLISELYNDIAYKFYYRWFKSSSYEEIQKMEKEELSEFGGLTDFIVWLISNNEKNEEKQKKLSLVIEKMDESDRIKMSPLINKLTAIKKQNQNQYQNKNQSQNQNLNNQENQKKKKKEN